MKRFLLLGVLVGLFAGQAPAAMWELDKATALGFTTFSVTTGSMANSLSVYDGPSPGTRVFGTGPLLYGPMSGQVGFYGGLAGDVVGGTATMEISFTGALALDGDPYDGIKAYLQNDDQSIWSFQLFYDDPTDGGERASAWVELAGLGGSADLTAPATGTGVLDLDDITNIGIRVKGNNMGGTNPGYPSYSDDFHVSVVPVPAALLLGLLGMGVAGLKLRRFA